MIHIHEFNEEQINMIEDLGICSSIGAMQGCVVPSKGTELSFEAFVKDYEEQARYAARTFYNDESKWKQLAEVWAGVDIDIVICALATVTTPEEREELLNKLFGW